MHKVLLLFLNITSKSEGIMTMNEECIREVHSTLFDFLFRLVCIQDNFSMASHTSLSLC